MTKKIGEFKKEIEEAKQERKRLLSHLRVLERQLLQYKQDEDLKRAEELRRQINDGV